MKIIIDSGHGGKDPGGGSNYLWKEKDKVLEISLYQYERFKELGIDVVLTRDKDVYLDSQERTKIVKDSKADICISNHINAFNGKAEGAETIHSIHSDGKLANLILDKLVEVGAKRRRVFCKEHETIKGKDYYYMHRLTGSVQTIIIEYGFADNADDTKRIADNWKTYAEVVIRAVCEYAGLDYIPLNKQSNNEVSSWAKEAHEWVVKNKISDGARPKDQVTREEVWTMLYRMKAGE